MFHSLIEPSLEAVMILSELGEKHNQVTALWMAQEKHCKRNVREGVDKRDNGKGRE